MKVKCFLCHGDIEVKSTRKGLPFIYCRSCQTRTFISSPQAIEALNEMTTDGELFSPEVQAVEPSPSAFESDGVTPVNPGADSANPPGTVFEIKALKERLTALEEQVSTVVPAAANPDSGKIVCPACSKEYPKDALLDQEIEGGFLSDQGILAPKGYYCECGRILLDKEGGPPSESIIDWDS